LRRIARKSIKVLELVRHVYRRATSFFRKVSPYTLRIIVRGNERMKGGEAKRTAPAVLELGEKEPSERQETRNGGELEGLMISKTGTIRLWRRPKKFSLMSKKTG